MLDVRYIKLSPVGEVKKKESLADYVRRIRNEKGLSLKGVEKASGGRISSGYIWQIENGETTNPTTDKLQALSRGLSIPQDEIFAIARGQSPLTEDEFLESKFG